MAKTFLTAEWNNLIMANYIVDPAVLLPYLPKHTELDVENGDAYVSLVGFMFEQTRLLGFKIPFHVNFEEVNLRFYVRFKDDGVWKRGTVFIKEIVPKFAISIVANTLYNEKYSTMPMKHFNRIVNDNIELGYHWKHNGHWNKLEAIAGHATDIMLDDSHEAFVAEHYWGYSKYNPDTTYEYEVQHPKWHLYPVKGYTIDVDFSALYGSHFSFLQTVTPKSVFVAKGSEIRILSKRSIS